MIKMICVIIFLVKVLLSYDMALWIQIINFMLEFLPNTKNSLIKMNALLQHVSLMGFSEIII